VVGKGDVGREGGRIAERENLRGGVKKCISTQRRGTTLKILVKRNESVGFPDKSRIGWRILKSAEDVFGAREKAFRGVRLIIQIRARRSSAARG
jgi:hypothetical protein